MTVIGKIILGFFSISLIIIGIIGILIIIINPPEKKYYEILFSAIGSLYFGSWCLYGFCGFIKEDIIVIKFLRRNEYSD